MTGQSGVPITKQRRWGGSVLALFAGFMAAVVLSLGTDFTLHAIGLWPALGEPMAPQLLAVATVYRAIYGVVSGYIIARMAPYRPLEHALIGGFIGLVLSLVGALATWNRGFGPHWYPVALVVLAVPSAWVGGRLRLAQLRNLATH